MPMERARSVSREYQSSKWLYRVQIFGCGSAKKSTDDSQINSVVILLPQVRNQILSHHPSQRILQFHGLDEQIVLRVQLRRAHRRLEVEAQPFLNPAHPCALRQVQKQNQIQDD